MSAAAKFSWTPASAMPRSAISFGRTFALFNTQAMAATTENPAMPAAAILIPGSGSFSIPE